MEAFQPITAKALKKCPECSKNALKRLISGGGAILFKGSGFYETDYRSSDYKQKADADKKAAEPKSESKSESKSDSNTKGGSGGSKTETKPDKKGGGSKKGSGSGTGSSSGNGKSSAKS